MASRTLITGARGRLLPAALALALWFVCLPGEALALKEGDPFPHFVAQDLTGATIDTKTLAGKVILIEFWSIYCSSCVQQMPHVAALQTKYQDQGLQCIGIDMDAANTINRVKKFLDGLDFKVTYPNINDGKLTIKTLLGVSVLPTTIIADTTGKVAMFHIGYKPGFEKELEEKVKKLLPAKK